MNKPTTMPKKTNATQTRRTWSHLEEQKLIDSLRELVVKGYKSDNGFRSGYLNLLEQSIAQHFPGTDLKAEPHISSKIHAWKKNFNCLTQMFAKSGFGLGPNFMIDVQDDVWDAYVKSEPSVRTMRFKTWPFYNDWAEIFGKDRATGESAIGFVDAMQDFLNTGNTEPAVSHTMPNENFAEESSTAYTTKGNAASSHTSSRTGKSKARKIQKSEDDPLLEKFDVYIERNDKTMHEIKYEFSSHLQEKKEQRLEAKRKRKQVYDMLENLDFPCFEEKVHVGLYLCMNDPELDYFESVPQDAKQVLVRAIIEKM